MNKKFWVAVCTIVAILVIGIVVSQAIEARMPVLLTSTATPAPIPTANPIPTVEIATAAPPCVGRITGFWLTTLATAGDYGVNGTTEGCGGVGLTMKFSYEDLQGVWHDVYELGVPKFTPNVDWPVWHTASLEPGDYLIRLMVKTSDDPNWVHPAVLYRYFTKK